MSVRLDNFVDVKIVKRVAQPSAAAFDTAVYLAPSGTTPGYVTLNGTLTPDGSKAKPYPASGYTDKYVQTFFANGGKYLHIIQVLNYADDENDDNCWVYKNTDAEDAIPLPLNEIVIFKASTATAGTDWNTVKEGVDQKIFVNTTNATTAITGGESGLVYRYVGASDDHPTDYGNAAIAAYYTKVNILNEATIRDYAFTAQSGLDETGFKEIIDSNADVSACIAHSLNCTVYLAGANRNIGGNDCVGEPITNVFMRIVLQQTLTNALLQVLVTKLRLNQEGLNKIVAAASVELNKYVNNGYIDSNKVWEEDSLYIDGELVAAQNTALPNGYVIHVAPITAENRKNHTAPTVYVVYGDQTGIRKIVIRGEAF